MRSITSGDSRQQCVDALETPAHVLRRGAERPQEERDALAQHRNKGIAKALKLETLRQAGELGVDAVETDNDFENAPILHLNQTIGYREVAGQIEFIKQLA